MKKILLTIVICFVSAASFGQDPELFRTWYLTEMTADLGDSLFVDDVIPSIAPNLTIESNLTYQGTMHCNDFQGEFGFNATDNLLTVNEFDRTFLFCHFLNLNNFEIIFAEYFTITNEYTFTITENNGVFYLDLLSFSAPGFDLRYQSVPLPTTPPDPVLIDTTWYLQDLVIDGNSYVPDYLGQHLEISFTEFNNDFFALNFSHEFGICTYPMKFLENNQFKYTGFVCLAKGICGIDACFDYFLRYRPFYEDYYNTVTDYAINFESDGSKSLVVTNVDGDQAFYSTNQIVLGVEDNPNLELVLYPNPATSELFIAMDEGIPIYSITIYSVSGERITHQQDPQNTVNISDLPTGLYFIEAISDKGREIQKFIKN